MNAYEIIGNILHEGISQCETSIWGRLKLPDFTEINPRVNFQQFDTTEEFLEYQLNDIIFSDLGLQIDYYALRPLMNEEEYETASEDYKQLVGTYFKYKDFWLKTSEKLIEIDGYRNEINCLFNNDLFDLEGFNSLHLSNKVLDMLGDIYRHEFKYEGQPSPASPIFIKGDLYYRCYYLIMKNDTDNKILKQLLTSIERDWRDALYYPLGIFPPYLYANIDEKREEMRELKANYLNLFHDYIKNTTKHVASLI